MKELTDCRNLKIVLSRFWSKEVLIGSVLGIILLMTLQTRGQTTHSEDSLKDGITILHTNGDSLTCIDTWVYRRLVASTLSYEGIKEDFQLLKRVQDTTELQLSLCRDKFSAIEKEYKYERQRAEEFRRKHNKQVRKNKLLSWTLPTGTAIVVAGVAAIVWNVLK